MAKLQKEVIKLTEKLSESERKQESSKVLTYMIIHDFRHPTSAIVSIVEKIKE